MKVIGNLIWFVFGGFAAAVMFFIAGIIMCLTLIGIPFGLQAFKLASLTIAPFGKKVVLDPAKHPIANAAWFVFFGWYISLFMVFASLALAISIIGLPIAGQTIKYAKLACFPFGSEVN